MKSSEQRKDEFKMFTFNPVIQIFVFVLIFNLSSGNNDNVTSKNQCDISCKTCDNSTFECLTCYGNSYPDNGICTQCPDGYFYSSSLGRCLDCEDSCLDLCTYRNQCLECPAGQYLDLATLECVIECNRETQIAINDTQFDNRLICRDFQYYVNPDSDSIIELGTIDHPYKQLAFVFVEILNYHSHTDCNLTISLMENTRNELTLGQSHIINLTHVDILSYSLTSYTPDKAIIVGKDPTELVASPSTQFNILKTFELRMDERIFNNSDITEIEKSRFDVEEYSILVLRSNFTINNMEITTEYADITADPVFFFLVYIQSGHITYNNLDISVSGTILSTYDPMNLYILNVNVDFYRNSGGFDMDAFCNYPEATLDANMVMENTTAYYSQDRVIFPIQRSIIRYSMPGSWIVTNHTAKIYILSNEQYGMLSFNTLSTCTPEIDKTRYYNLTDVYLPLIEQESGISTNVAVLWVDTDIYITTLAYLKNVHTSNNRNSFYSSLFFIGNIQSQVTIDGLYVSNSSSRFSVQSYLLFGKLDISNMYVDHTDAVDDLIFEFFVAEIKLSNITIDNNDISNQESTGIFYINNFPGTAVTVSNIDITNSNLGPKHAIEYDQTTEGSMTIENAYVDNVTLGTDTKIFRAQSLTNFSMDNSMFSNVHPKESSDSSIKIIRLSSLTLVNQMSYIFSNNYIEQSTIGLIELSNIESTESLSTEFIISNFTFVDSYFEFSQDLISFGSIETTNDFAIKLSDITMQNITFVRTGSLFMLGHQTSTTLTITNAHFSNLIGAKIMIKSSNLQNTQLVSKVKMTNITATLLTGNSNSFISIDEGGELYIDDSSFTNIDNTERGAVLNAGYRNSMTEVRNSTFKNNVSIFGGVANVQDGSVIKFYDCSLTQNFAIQSGVIQSSNDGYFEIYRSLITENYAYTISVSEIFIVNQPCIISNSSLSNNIIITKNEILSQFENCNFLCFIPTVYIDFINSNLNLLDAGSIHSSIQCVSGAIAVMNNTYISNQLTFVDGYLSEISIEKSTIYGITSDYRIITLISSNLILNDCVFTDIHSNYVGQILGISFETYAHISNITVSNSTVKFVGSLSSSVQLTNIHATNMTLKNHLIGFIDCFDVVMHDIYIENTKSEYDFLMLLSNTKTNSIINVTINNINTNVIHIPRSTVNLISDFNIYNASQGIQIKSSNISMMQNCSFSYIGSSHIKQGGALYLEDTHININNVIFENNKAESGGAIFMGCNAYYSCSSNIEHSQFINNIAIEQGGGISYNFKRPNLLSTTFIGNQAMYGPNLASYPVRIIFNNSISGAMRLTDVVSGITYPDTINLTIVDLDNQVMNLLNSGQIKIVGVTDGASVRGIDSSRLKNGVAQFDSIQFVHIPGQSNTTYQVVSNLIDLNKVRYLDLPTSNSISVSFRYCKPGEVIVDDSTCRVCDAGTYSLQWNSTECYECMDNAVCAGGADIRVDEKYWRNTMNSTEMLECPNPSACKGGYQPDLGHPVNCELGYEGYLCSKCVVNELIKYEIVGAYSCSKCPDPVWNAIRFCLLIIGGLIFVMILVIDAIRKNKEDQASILLRIFTNYFQLIALVFSFDFKYPKLISGILTPISHLTSASGVFLSFDCFIKTTEIKLFTPSNEIFKVFCVQLLPIILIILISCIFILIHCLCRSKFRHIKRKIAITAVCVIFLLHPTTTISAFSLLKCQQTENDTYRMRMHIDYDCYSTEHIVWIMKIAVPGLIVWVLGIPIFALAILYKNRHNLDSGPTRLIFLMLYQGYKHDKFYWEFVNTFRKVLLLVFSTVLSLFSVYYAAIISIATLWIMIHTQHRIQPYVDKRYNTIEIKAMLASCMTLYCGILFEQEDAQEKYKGCIILAMSLLL